jgi:hypothetical protein
MVTFFRLVCVCVCVCVWGGRIVTRPTMVWDDLKKRGGGKELQVWDANYLPGGVVDCHI